MTQPSFKDVLHELSGGRSLHRLNEELGKVIDLAQSYGQKGTITLKVDIQPMGDDVVTFTDTITPKYPQPKQMRTNFFLTEDGLSRRDPRQADIEDFSKADIKEVK